MKATFLRTLLPAVLTALALGACTPVRWPYDPGNTTYNLGNNYGEYQNYGGSPYYHDGLDILAGSPRPVYAVAAGTITHITDDGGGLYSGIMIGKPTSGGTGYLYWHIDSSTIAVSVGDTVNEGDYLGDVVNWPVAGFHHIHFNRVRGTGGYPWGWYTSISNPISYLKPRDDNSAPVFENAGSGARFLFCEDNTSNYLNPNNLQGKVDIIARVKDKFNGGTWDMVPYFVTVRIRRLEGGSVVYNRSSVLFEGELGNNSTITTVYKDDTTADTKGDYTAREFYFIVTNNDGDLSIEPVDTDGAWDTTTVPDGEYEITVLAEDRSGNDASTSMNVTVNN